MRNLRGIVILYKLIVHPMVRVGAAHIEGAECIAILLEGSSLGIYGHAAIVTHMLMCSGCEIEKRGLSAVRITNQGYVNCFSFM